MTCPSLSELWRLGVTCGVLGFVLGMVATAVAYYTATRGK